MSKVFDGSIPSPVGDLNGHKVRLIALRFQVEQLQSSPLFEELKVAFDELIKAARSNAALNLRPGGSHDAAIYNSAVADTYERILGSLEPVIAAITETANEAAIESELPEPDGGADSSRCDPGENAGGNPNPDGGGGDSPVRKVQRLGDSRQRGRVVQGMRR